MTPLCPQSGRVIAYSKSHRVKCACGRRVLLVGHKLSAHRVPAKKQRGGVR